MSTLYGITDLAKLQYNDPAVGLIEESLAAAPEVNAIMGRTIPGTTYKTLVRTSLPAGAFTRLNEGVNATASVLEQRISQCYLYRNAVQIDLAAENASEGLGIGDLEMIESLGVVEDALRKIGKQIWYGTTTDSKGFPGLKSVLAKGDATVTDAGGNTSNLQSSVYFVKVGIKDVHLLYGNGATLALSPFANQTLYDANSYPYAGRVANLTSWVGMQVGNANAVGRICNLTEAVPLTDVLLAKELALFKIGYRPTHIFMSRRSRRQLQVARTVTLFGQSGQGGAKSAATLFNDPDEFMGIPIITTDQILDTDAVE